MVVAVVFGNPALAGSGFWGITATGAIGAGSMLAASHAHGLCSAVCESRRGPSKAVEIDDPARAAAIEAEDLAISRFVAQVEADRRFAAGPRRLH